MIEGIGDFKAGSPKGTLNVERSVLIVLLNVVSRRFKARASKARVSISIQ